jgi:hypothetical protein
LPEHISVSSPAHLNDSFSLFFSSSRNANETLDRNKTEMSHRRVSDFISKSILIASMSSKKRSRTKALKLPRNRFALEWRKISATINKKDENFNEARTER